MSVGDDYNQQMSNWRIKKISAQNIYVAKRNENDENSQSSEKSCQLLSLFSLIFIVKFCVSVCYKFDFFRFVLGTIILIILH